MPAKQLAAVAYIISVLGVEALLSISTIILGLNKTVSDNYYRRLYHHIRHP